KIGGEVQVAHAVAAAPPHDAFTAHLVPLHPLERLRLNVGTAGVADVEVLRRLAEAGASRLDGVFGGVLWQQATLPQWKLPGRHVLRGVLAVLLWAPTLQHQCAEPLLRQL